jgi:molybdate transport system substrate-binding protein
MGRIRACLALVLFVSLSACAAPSQPESLLIATAASLAPALQLIGQEFTSHAGVAIVLSVGSTGNLAAQIENGGPFDVFVSADSQRIDQLIASGHLDLSTRTAFADGILVLANASDTRTPARSIAGLADAQIGNIAIANPIHAPYGFAAREALMQSGLWETVQDKIVLAESVGQAAIFVGSGNASAGLLAQSVALNIGLESEPVPRNLYSRIEHIAAALTTTQNPEIARDFIQFLLNSESQQLLEDHGFITPVEK